jgi:hypothetical protein
MSVGMEVEVISYQFSVLSTEGGEKDHRVDKSAPTRVSVPQRRKRLTYKKVEK